VAASEKLKALVGDFWENEPPEGPEAPDAVIAALPQLLAVVEALESATGMASARDPEAYKQWFFGQRQVALAALKEALS
jgi:hypothetical protein